MRTDRLKWRVRGRLIRRAASVVAISRSTADDGIRLLGLQPSRIHVVHLGVGAEFVPPPDQAVRATSPYVLSVNAYGPHKGYPEAFRLIAALAAAGFPHRLRVVGTIARRMKPIVQMELRRAGATDLVDMLGVVSREDLVRLYQEAAAVVVTSRYEGFGLPALEAMATGAPVLAFANSSIPEVVGDGGILVDDGDVLAMTASAVRVLSDRRLADDLSSAALARASQFSWDRCAREHADILRGMPE